MEDARRRRSRRDVTAALIVAIHDAHKGRYGIERIHADLAQTSGSH